MTNIYFFMNQLRKRNNLKIVFLTAALLTLISLTLALFLTSSFVPMASGSITPPTPEEQSRLEQEKETARSRPAEPDRLSGADLAALIVTDIALLGLATLAFWLVLFRKAEKGLPFLALNKWMIIVGIAMLPIGPILGKIKPFRYPPGVQAQPPSALLSAYVRWGPMVMVGLIALGWVLIAASLRPRQSYVKGALLGAITYYLIGVGWVINFNAALRSVEAQELISRPSLLPSLLEISFLWPMQIAQWLELFGLAFR